MKWALLLVIFFSSLRLLVKCYRVIKMCYSARAHSQSYKSALKLTNLLNILVNKNCPISLDNCELMVNGGDSACYDFKNLIRWFKINYRWPTTRVRPSSLSFGCSELTIKEISDEKAQDAAKAINQSLRGLTPDFFSQIKNKNSFMESAEYYCRVNKIVLTNPEICLG